MELWIRSQDKRQLLKVNDGLFIANGFKDTTDTFIGIKNIGHIGRYATEKRALEILNEIQKLLKPKVEYTPIIDEDLKPEYTYKYYRQIGSETSVMELNTYVYQMPEE